MKKNISLLSIILSSTLLSVTLLTGCGGSSSNDSNKASQLRVLESRSNSNYIASSSQVMEAINSQLDNMHSVKKVVLSPHKYGAAVLIETQGGFTIYLYGLENPQNPQREYPILQSDDDHLIKEMQLKNGGILEYIIYDYISQTQTKVTYNYFEGKEISKDSISNDNSNLSIKDRVKKALEAEHEGQHWEIRQIVLTPKKNGAIIETVTDMGSFLELYGIEDPDNPINEKLIGMDDLGHANYRDITMLGDGKLKYTTIDYGNHQKDVTITYDYFHKKVISTDR